MAFQFQDSVNLYKIYLSSFFTVYDVITDLVFKMDSHADGKVYYLRVTENIMRIFFVNNAQDPVLLTINYGQPLADKISIPVGNSNLCLCSNSDIGQTRKKSTYFGLYLHTQNTQTQMKLSKSKDSDFAIHVTLCNIRALPTLVQLSKQFIREHGKQKCTRTKFLLLKEELPIVLAENVCEDYKELRTNNFLQSDNSAKRFYCKCSLFWYAPSQCFSQFGPNHEMKYVKQFHNNKYIGFKRINE